jgi:hypothetical protein
MAGDNGTLGEEGLAATGEVSENTPEQGVREKGRSEFPWVSVESMSPEYPRHRDALIICATVVILLVLVVGGYFLLQGKSMSLPKFAREPVQFVRNLLSGGETYSICSQFVRTHEGLFRELGGDLKWTMVKQEIRIVNKDKKARILLKMRGNKGTRFVYFLLKKYGDTWRITSVNMEVGKGRYRRIYPGKKAKTRDARYPAHGYL